MAILLPSTAGPLGIGQWWGLISNLTSPRIAMIRIAMIHAFCGLVCPARAKAPPPLDPVGSWRQAGIGSHKEIRPCLWSTGNPSHHRPLTPPPGGGRSGAGSDPRVSPWSRGTQELGGSSSVLPVLQLLVRQLKANCCYAIGSSLNKTGDDQICTNSQLG